MWPESKTSAQVDGVCLSTNSAHAEFPGGGGERKKGANSSNVAKGCREAIAQDNKL